MVQAKAVLVKIHAHNAAPPMTGAECVIPLVTSIDELICARHDPDAAWFSKL